MKSVCLVDDVLFQGLLGCMVQSSDEISKCVLPLIGDSPYNLNQIASLSSSEHKFLILWEMRPFVGVLSAVMHVGGRVHLFALPCVLKRGKIWA